MKSWTLTIILGIGLVFSVFLLILNLRDFQIPDIQQGYEPEQPIAFSHRLHAGELGVGCQYCHSGAAKSRYAGIPSAEVCMNCHTFVTASIGAIRAEDELAIEEEREPRKIISDDLRLLYDAMGFDDNLKPDSDKTPKFIEWIKVHNVPDFVYFDHRPHVSAGVDCSECHGPVETMETMRQFQSLSMGWCVNCHRDANEDGVNGKHVSASTNCVTCHY
ncbi:MAG: cytochrome c3 family protein [bacterium]|nr:cytochrome c3 family protein [bacterium]